MSQRIKARQKERYESKNQKGKKSRGGTNGRVGSARPGPDAGDDEGDVTTATDHDSLQV